MWTERKRLSVTFSPITRKILAQFPHHAAEMSLCERMRLGVD